MAGSYDTGHAFGCCNYLLINIIMVEWLCNLIFKKYIDEIVEKKFAQLSTEKYNGRETQSIRDRIEQARQNLHSSSGVQQTKHPEVLSSSRVRTGSEEPKLSITPDQAAIAKAAELDAMRAKLLGKKK